MGIGDGGGFGGEGEYAEVAVNYLSALEDYGNQGRFPMTRKKKKKGKCLTHPYKVKEQEMGNYILLSDHRGILNRSSCKTFQAREGQKSDSECSAWISQGQILSNQPDCLLQWMTGFVDEGRILDSFILTFSSLMIQSLVGSF